MSFIPKKPLVVCDIEVCPNAYLIGFKSLDKNKIIQIKVYGEDDSLTVDQRKQLRSILSKYTIVTFNGERYDVLIMQKSLEGITCKQIFKMSEQMISEGYPAWMSIRNFGIESLPNLTHVDLSPVAPGVMISLKMYGARLGSNKIQDLPYAYDKPLTPVEFDKWCEYNINDLEVTSDLYKSISKAVQLRFDMSEQYKIDLMSKGDAQIAETVIIHELKKKGVTAKKVTLPSNYSFKYKAPECVKFMSDDLNDILQKVQEEDFKLKANGAIDLPEWLAKRIITIGDTNYNVGIGGLHSQEKKLVVESDEKVVLRNADVASYYPSMIIEFGYYPAQMGKSFLDVFSEIYWTRNHPITGAKIVGNKVLSDVYKIVLNGSFGKLGSKYSKLYAPDLLLQVTLTGQLLLLMLIEQLELHGFKVVSSNTDGVEYVCDRDKQDIAESIVFDWELDTGMVMEHGVYKALYARDVNNYVAVYDGYIKAKGVYGETTLNKNVEYPIVFKAIEQYILNKKPFKDTIDDCDDINQFITCKKCTAGAKWRGTYLGKVVRWYYSTDGDPILSTKNHNKVAKSDDAKPMMDMLQHIPVDLDKEKYIKLCIKHLKDLGLSYVDPKNHGKG